MLTDQQLFAARDGAIRIREIGEEKTKIVITGTIRGLDAMIELAKLAEELGPLVMGLVEENAALRKQLAGGNRP